MTSHSPLLSQIHAALAAQQGRIPFDEFMQLALYAVPGGYYRRHKTVIGKAGDFITASEISPLFSHCFARCFQSLQKTQANAVLFEFGAGNGTFAADVLDYLRLRNSLPTRYYILELSAQLAQTQKQTILAKHADCLTVVEWVSVLPEKIHGMVIANEVLDAMPIKLFRYHQNRPSECYVEYVDDQFRACYDKPTSALTKALSNLHLEAAEYQSEINLHIQPWLASIATMLESGVVYLIDYGFPRHEYYHPSRTMGTLMCHHHHQAHPDPFVAIGEQDITAHVDFTAVAEAALAADFDVAGFTNQATFLLNCDLLADLTESISIHISQAIKQLTMPHEMGELFKVMALTKGPVTASGFSVGDKRHTL